MASSDNMSEFECSICCEILEDPRLLPCGHLFCGPSRGCISQIGANRTIVECPNCRKTHYINVNNLQPIYVLKNFLEGQKSASSTKSLIDLDPVTVVKNACEVHSGQSLSYFCEDCAINICEVCWGNDHAGHVVMLLKVKQRKEVTQAIEKADLESLIAVYDKVIADNRKRRQLVLEVLTETDVVNQLLASRKNDLAELENRCKEFKESSSVKGEDLGELLLSDLQKHFESNSDDNIKVTIKHISQESQKKFNRFVSSCSQNEKNLNELSNQEQKNDSKAEMKGPESSKNDNRKGQGDAEREQSASKLPGDLESMKLKPGSKSVVGESSSNTRGGNGSQRVSSVSSAFLNTGLDANLADDNDDDASSASEDRASCVSTSVLTETNNCNANRPKKERTRRGKRTDAGSSVGGARGGRGCSRGGAVRHPPPPLGRQNSPNERPGMPGFPHFRGPPPPRPMFHGGPPPPRNFRPPPPPTGMPPGPPRNFRPPPPPNIPFPPPPSLGSFQPQLPPPLHTVPNSSHTATGSGGDQILEIKGCLIFIRGDIFQSKHSIAYTISQELNYNYGLSVEIAKRFSPIPKLVRQSKKAGGDVHFFNDNRTNPPRYVYTLVTSLQGKNKCSFSSLEKCLQTMRDHASRNNIKTICVPSTLACQPEEGLAWSSVEVVIKSTFTGTDINVFIYS